MAWITCYHHILGIKHLLGEFRDSESPINQNHKLYEIQNVYLNNVSKLRVVRFQFIQLCTVNKEKYKILKTEVFKTI